MENFIEIGKKIYRLNVPREAHRFAVFLARCLLNPSRISELKKFFSSNETLKKILEVYPFAYEQITRSFFFYKSTYEARFKLITEHMEFFLQNFSEEFLLKFYAGEKFELWKYYLDEELGEMRLNFCCEPGQRKEGLASIILNLSDGTPIYQIIFWIAKDNLVGQKNSSGENAMWIGAMQGPNVENSKELIKKITKKCHAYRTKNLILYAAQAVARNLGLKKIFAVTNYGYYANNHVRLDRKLKTSFGDFWSECGGKLTDDERFFELPLIESRKNFDEIPVRKRAVYKRRFEFLDNLDATVKKVFEEELLCRQKAIC